MRCLVVYESMYGNTRDVAEAIAKGATEAMVVALDEVSDAPSQLDPDVDLIIVGGPTHAFGMTRQATREDAARQASGPVVSTGVGIREWLDAVTIDGEHRFATFDTRILKPHVPGSAAAKAAKRLRRMGLHQVVPPESFWVVGTQGPIVEGELDRASAWGTEVALLSSKV